MSVRVCVGSASVGMGGVVENLSGSFCAGGPTTGSADGVCCRIVIG